jgi:plasmid stabilization system protein ParE
VKIVFLPSADTGVRWFTRYYRTAFPEGGRSAQAQMARTLAVLADNPCIGYPYLDKGLREYSIRRTPFSLLYRIAEDRIEILRLWDKRANPDRLHAPIEESEHQ